MKKVIFHHAVNTRRNTILLSFFLLLSTSRSVRFGKYRDVSLITFSLRKVTKKQIVTYTMQIRVCLRIFGNFCREDENDTMEYDDSIKIWLNRNKKKKISFTNQIEIYKMIDES